jgi:glycosyltransferase involved in cell wall biosynthesis
LTAPRIAHVISARGLAGAERFLAALVVAGHERGWDQLVLNPFANDSLEHLAALCDPVDCQGRSGDHLLDVPSMRRWLRGRIRDFRPQIVHAMLFPALVLTATLPKRRGTSRLVTNVSGDWALSTHGRLTEHVDRLAGDRYDRVVAISRYVEEFLLSEYGYSPSKVTCIPLGWRGEPQPPSSQERPPTIICVASLRPEKCHQVLLAALSLVRREVPTARLVLVGDGGMRRGLQAQTEAMGLGGGVEFRGAVEEVWSHLAEADVFAIASRSEAFCIAVVEAMAAGLPVVAPAVGAIPELVSPGITGELFPPSDHEALARHIVHLLLSAELRSRMGAAAREAAAPLRLDRAIDRYFGVYEELLQMARPLGTDERRRSAGVGQPGGVLS